MPSLPMDEDRSEEMSNAEAIREFVRDAIVATVPEKVGLRAWIALIVVLVVVVTNPEIALAAAGSIAVIYLAADLTRVGKR